jgi:isopenicillin-N N-acyltransferase-like protein
MKEIENDPEELISSRIRYFRALRLLNQSDSHTIKSLQAIQRDHVNYPNSICKHDLGEDDPLDKEKTINALVIDLTAREMHIAWGNPCKNAYHTYHLDA